MVIRRLISEWLARLLLTLLIVSMFAAIVIGRRPAQAVEIHAVMPEKGGWLPGNLAAEVGVPLMLRLTSDDVMHGFAVGQQPWPAVDVKPGQVTELSLTFDEPGTYTYYCTRWCGPNHWRMRGTIEVTSKTGSDSNTHLASTPRYVDLDLDIDAPHTVDVRLDEPPSSVRGSALEAYLPAHFLASEFYQDQSPYDAWQALNAEPDLADLTDSDIWDLVAFVWRSQTTPESLQIGQRLYAENCAACHGESGGGNGVMAWSSSEASSDGQKDESGTVRVPPVDFGDSTQMLGASLAVLQGKIIRGGMGTGMPYWGTIFTDEEIEALVDYIWTFQFPITADE